MEVSERDLLVAALNLMKFVLKLMDFALKMMRLSTVFDVMGVFMLAWVTTIDQARWEYDKDIEQVFKTMNSVLNMMNCAL